MNCQKYRSFDGGSIVLDVPSQVYTVSVVFSSHSHVSLAGSAGSGVLSSAGASEAASEDAASDSGFASEEAASDSAGFGASLPPAAPQALSVPIASTRQSRIAKTFFICFLLFSLEDVFITGYIILSPLRSSGLFPGCG